MSILSSWRGETGSGHPHSQAWVSFCGCCALPAQPWVAGHACAQGTRAQPCCKTWGPKGTKSPLTRTLLQMGDKSSLPASAGCDILPGAAPTLTHSSILKFSLAARSQPLLWALSVSAPAAVVAFSTVSFCLSTKAPLGLPGFSHGLITNPQLLPAAQELLCAYFASPPT